MRVWDLGEEFIPRKRDSSTRHVGCSLRTQLSEAKPDDHTDIVHAFEVAFRQQEFKAHRSSHVVTVRVGDTHVIATLKEFLDFEAKVLGFRPQRTIHH